MINLRELLEILMEKKGSDLHLAVGYAATNPRGRPADRTGYGCPLPELTKKLAYSMMSEKQKQRFEENSELDMSFGIENMSRFRCNVFMQRGNVAVALRQIPLQGADIRRTWCGQR